MANRLLSKSKYLNGLQCPKLLWLVCNDPDQVPGPDASTLHIFDQGHLVGELAKKLFPAGIDIPHADFKLNLSRTRELITGRRPLFEASFMAGRLFSRLDILNPSGLSEWDIVEVKSSTSVKDENIHDVSFQKLCAEQQGLTVDKCYLAFINNQYVRQGAIDPARLFTVQDITGEVAAASEGIQDRIRSMFEIMSAPRCPEVPLDSYCTSPYDCPVTLCRAELPANNILSLYRGGRKCFTLLQSGIFYLKDIPADFKLSPPQKIQQWCDVHGVPHIEANPLRDFLGKLQPPLHYLDFETINPAVPLFDGVRPYQQVPFQFSLHILDGGKMRHSSYLADGPADPRPEFLRRLKAALGPAGSIVTYNQSFEEGVLQDLAAAFPDYAEWVAGIRGRLVDLLQPFRSFHYYHPAQNGSASIKHVLPALTGSGYEGLAIGDGDAASRAFLNITWGEATDEERRQVRADLEKYCGLDTEAMIRIVEKLRAVAGPQYSLF
jgi:hypothetical protein